MSIFLTLLVGLFLEPLSFVFATFQFVFPLLRFYFVLFFFVFAFWLPPLYTQIIEIILPTEWTNINLSHNVANANACYQQIKLNEAKS